MPTIITVASKELSFQCITEEFFLIRKLIKPVPVQCVQDVISSLFFPHTVCCLQFVVRLELHRRDSDRIYLWCMDESYFR